MKKPVKERILTKNDNLLIDNFHKKNASIFMKNNPSFHISFLFHKDNLKYNFSMTMKGEMSPSSLFIILKSAKYYGYKTTVEITNFEFIIKFNYIGDIHYILGGVPVPFPKK